MSQETKNNTLISRAQDQIALWQLLEETGGEVCPAMESWLNEVDKNLTTKVDSYKFFQDELSANSERLRAEAAELTLAARSLENVSDRLKERIKIVMSIMNIDEIKGQKYRYKLSNSAPKLVINDAELPDSLMIYITTKTPDKERIKELLKLGEPIMGARFEPVQSIRAYVNKDGSK